MLASKFTILTAAINEQIHLLAGQPQISSTAPGYTCSDRSETTGACLPTSSLVNLVQVSYFSFYSSLVEGISTTSSDILITVIPKCNNTQASVSQVLVIIRKNYLNFNLTD